MTKMKTRYFTMIHLELQNAEKKHPNFVSAIIDPSSRVSWAESEARIKARNAMTKEYADNVLMEEVSEAFNAYQQGDKAQALQEFAQCGAVILRIMDFVSMEIDKEMING